MRHAWLMIAAVTALIGFLLWRFPYQLHGADDRVQFFYYLTLLALIGSRVLLSDRKEFGTNMKYFLAWALIAGVLLLGYSYRDLITGSRVYGTLFPNQMQHQADGTFTLQAHENGHFQVEGKANGARVNFMIDSGASDIMLSKADAERAGIDLRQLRYTRNYNTANGLSGGAPATLHQLEIGPLVLSNVSVFVNEGEMDDSLLGMSFLRQMKTWRMQGDTLILEP